jgi:hypothetical protein
MTRLLPSNRASADTAGQSVMFNTGIVARSFLQSSTTSFNGTLTIAPHATGASPADNYSLLGSAYSFFQRQTTSVGGNIIETVNNLPELANLVLKCTANKAELDSMIGLASSGSGNSIGVLLGSQVQAIDFSIPLIGVFNCNKYIPLFVAEINIEFIVADIIQKFLVSLSTKVPSGFTLTNLTMTYNVMELEQAVFQEVMAQYPSGKMNLLTSSYSFASGQIAASAGTQSLVYPHRFSSVKQVYFQVVHPGMADKNIGSVNPNLNRYIELSIGGERFPQGIVAAKNYAQAFNQLQKAFGSLYSTGHSGSITRANFTRAANASGTYGALANDPSAIVNGSAANQFYMALDMERMAHSKTAYYNGVSSIGQSSTISLDIDIAPASPLILNFWSHYDVVVVFDIFNSTVSAES